MIPSKLPACPRAPDARAAPTLCTIVVVAMIVVVCVAAALVAKPSCRACLLRGKDASRPMLV